jgi:carbon monoxide dehydrogenase subunit G
MPRVESSVVVEAPPERVWAFVSDVSRCPEWVTFADEMGHIDAGDPGEGFRYVEYGGLGPIRSESDWEIVEFDPPRRQVHVGDMGIMQPELTITVEPEGEGTRWTQTVEFEALPRLRPVGWLLERLVIRRRMARGLERTMTAGKELVEREHRADSEGATATT